MAIEESAAQRRIRERKAKGTQTQQRRKKLKSRKGVLKAKDSSITGFNLPFNTVVDPESKTIRPFVQDDDRRKR